MATAVLARISQTQVAKFIHLGNRAEGAHCYPKIRVFEPGHNFEYRNNANTHYSIEIEADDNLIEFVEYKLAGKNLRISTSRDISSYKKLSVRVTYTDNFNMLIAKDETNVTALSDVVLDNVTFKSYDYSKLFLNAKTKNFTLMANDKSKVELNLKSEKTAVDVSKSAYVKALISSG